MKSTDETLDTTIGTLTGDEARAIIRAALDLRRSVPINKAKNDVIRALQNGRRAALRKDQSRQRDGRTQGAAGNKRPARINALRFIATVARSVKRRDGVSKQPPPIDMLPLPYHRWAS